MKGFHRAQSRVHHVQFLSAYSDYRDLMLSPKSSSLLARRNLRVDESHFRRTPARFRSVATPQYARSHCLALASGRRPGAFGRRLGGSWRSPGNPRALQRMAAARGLAFIMRVALQAVECHLSISDRRDHWLFFETLAEPKLIHQLCFTISQLGHLPPRGMTNNPSIKRFEVYVAGIEFGNAFSD